MADHGTEGGYSAHRRANERACSDCYDVHYANNRARRKATRIIKGRPVKPATPTQSYPDFSSTDQPIPCRENDPEYWFQTRAGMGANATAARVACYSCPLLEECRNYALAWDLYGIWGGLTRTERRKIQKDRKIDARPVLAAS